MGIAVEGQVAEFSIQDVAFTGFRVVREHRAYLATWAGLFVLVSFILTATMIVLAGPAMMSLTLLGASGTRDPATVFPLLAKLLPIYAILTPIAIVFNGILYAAMNRAVLRPLDTRFAYLAFGADEMRQMALLLFASVVFFALYVAVFIGLVVIGALLSLAAHVAATAFSVVAVFLVFGIFVWVAVRLSLASAMTFERRRVDLFGSWALTRGRFWSLFGTYVLVLALAAVVLILTYLVIFAIVAVATGGDLASVMAPADMGSLGAYFTVAHLVQLVLGGGVSALISPVVLTPPAAIFRNLSTIRVPT